MYIHTSLRTEKYIHASLIHNVPSPSTVSPQLLGRMVDNLLDCNKLDEAYSLVTTVQNKLQLVASLESAEQQQEVEQIMIR